MRGLRLAAVVAPEPWLTYFTDRGRFGYGEIMRYSGGSKSVIPLGSSAVSVGSASGTRCCAKQGNEPSTPIRTAANEATKAGASFPKLRRRAERRARERIQDELGMANAECGQTVRDRLPERTRPRNPTIQPALFMPALDPRTEESSSLPGRGSAPTPEPMALAGAL